MKARTLGQGYPARFDCHKKYTYAMVKDEKCYNLHPIVTHLKAHKGGLPAGEGEGELPMTSSAFTSL